MYSIYSFSQICLCLTLFFGLRTECGGRIVQLAKAATVLESTSTETLMLTGAVSLASTLPNILIKENTDA